MQAPLIALNNKIPPKPQIKNVYVERPRIIGAGIKNNEIMNLKILSALF
tara:strand:- start:113 stop:259 length:147 start_codon:yes stop_codon:yes gene_type:complete